MSNLDKLKKWINGHKENIINVVKKWTMFFINPRFVLCFLFAWLITNGWSYILFAVGTVFNIIWMIVVSSAYMTFLWFPFTPEKVVTFIIAIFLLKILFPNDQKTLKVLREELERAKTVIRRRKENKRQKKKFDSNCA